MPFWVKTILCAIDLTESSELVIMKSLSEAKVHGARVHVLHVNPGHDAHTTMPLATFMGEKRFEELLEEKRKETNALIRRKIEEIVERAAGNHPDITADAIDEIHLEAGDPIVGILNTARDVRADLVVMGTHGKGLMEHTFLGNVAQKVIRRITIPVLLVPAVPHARHWE